MGEARRRVKDFVQSANRGFVQSVNRDRNYSPANRHKLRGVTLEVLPQQHGNGSLLIVPNPALVGIPGNPDFLSFIAAQLELLAYQDSGPQNVGVSRYRMYWTERQDRQIENVRFDLIGFGGSLHEELAWEPDDIDIEPGRTEFEWASAGCSLGIFENSTGRHLASLIASKVYVDLGVTRFPACISGMLNGVRSCIASRLLGPGSGDNWSYSGERVELKSPILEDPGTFGQGGTPYSSDRRYDVKVTDTIPLCCDIS